MFIIHQNQKPKNVYYTLYNGQLLHGRFREEGERKKTERQTDRQAGRDGDREID